MFHRNEISGKRKWLSCPREFMVLSVLMLVSCVFLWSDFVLGFRLPFHDTIGFFYPWREFLSDCLQVPSIPIWDSLNGPGFPITFFTAPLWNPIAYIFCLARDYDISRLLSEIYFLSFVSSLGCFYWLRCQDVSRLLALCGAGVWVASAPYFTSVQGLTIYTTISCLPWLFLSIDLVCASNIRRNCYAGVVIMASSVWIMVAGGYIGLSVPIFYFVFLYAVSSFFQNLRYARRILFDLLLTALICVLLIAGPITDYLQVRGVMDELRSLAAGGYDPFTSSLPLNSVWTLLLVHGGYLPHITIGRAEQLYMGGALFLAIPGCLAVLRPNRRDLTLLMLAILVFVTAMGQGSPLAVLVMKYVPLMSSFRHHVFWSPVIILLLIALSLRLITRFVQEKYSSEISFTKIGIFYCVIIGGMGYGALHSYYSATENTESYILTAFELVEYMASLSLLGAFLAYIFVKGDCSRPFVSTFALLLGTLCLLIPAGLLYWYGFDLLEPVAKGLDGLYVPLPQIKVDLSQGLLFSRIAVGAIGLLRLDLLYTALLCTVFVVLLSRYIRSRDKRWVSCFVLLVFLDMFFASHRYFIGNLQYLGNTTAITQKSYWTKSLDVSLLTKNRYNYYSSVKCDVGVMKGDRVSLRLVMDEVPDPTLSVVVRLRSPQSPRRIYEKGFSGKDFGKDLTVSYSGTAMGSGASLQLEILYYSSTRPPRPRVATISLARVLPSSNIENHERSVRYQGNSRQRGSYDTPQFSNGRMPAVSTYSPMFNPAVGPLSREENGDLLFSKLLWTIEKGREITLGAWPEIATVPKMEYIVLSPNALGAEIVVDRPSMLVWTDAWDSGWSATVNGKEVTVSKVLGILKAISIPAGRSQIHFRYRSVERLWGLIFTTVGIAAILIIVATILMNKKLRKV